MKTQEIAGNPGDFCLAPRKLISCWKTGNELEARKKQKGAALESQPRNEKDAEGFNKARLPFFIGLLARMGVGFAGRTVRSMEFN